MNTQIKSGPLPAFPDLLFDLLLGLGHDLFDSPRMDPAVGDQPLQGDAGDFPANGIEPGNDHGLGRVVDDQVYAGCRFQSADISPFPSDDPPLHLLVRER